MFRNLTVKNKVEYNLSRYSTFILISIITISIAIGVYVYVKYIQQIKNWKDGQSEQEAIDKYTAAVKKYLNTLYLNSSLETVDIYFNTYTFTDELYPSLKWFDKDGDFQDTLEITMKIVYSATVNPTEKEKNMKKWKIAETLINTICKKFIFPLRPYTFPWGTNWYSFSIILTRIITFCTFLYRDQFKKPNKTIEYWLKNAVPQILKSPRSSLGWTRDGANSVMMCVPFVGAKIISGKPYENHPDYKYVINYIKIQYVTSGEGFYHDGGYITHSNCRAYGYVYNAAVDFTLLAEMHDITTTKAAIKKIKLILDHSSIRYHNCSLYSRSPTMRMNVFSPEGSLGFDIIPSMSILSIKQEKSFLQFWGQKKQYCFYEADQSNNKISQYWVMARQYLYEENDVTLYTENITRYPGIISINNQPVIIPSTTDTTQTFLPTEAFSIICKVNDECVAIFNSYDIEQFGFKVEEITLVQKEGYTTNYFITKHTTTDKEPLYISVNYGPQAIEPIASIDQINTAYASKIYNFKNNSSIIHNIANFIPTIETVTIKHPIQSDTLMSLQLKCIVNEKSEFNACFSTYHDNSPPLVHHASRRILLTSQYKVFYTNNRLYLCDVDNSRVAIGIKSDNPETYLRHEFKNIKPIFGNDAKIENYGKEEIESSAYIDVTHHLRNFSTFSNINMPDDNIIKKMVRQDLKDILTVF